MNIQYDIQEFFEIDFETFKQNVAGQVCFDISYPLSSIGVSRSRIDIVHDYSEASFFCESIAPFIKVESSRVVEVGSYSKAFRISCKAIDSKRLYDKLKYFHSVVFGFEEDIDSSEKESYLDELLNYEDTFNKKRFAFPELINGYWANLVNGAYWEIASEYYESEGQFFSKTYRKYPEHRFGFWRNPFSLDFSEVVFFSTENWIVPPNTNLIRALNLYSDIEEDINFDETDKIDFNGSIVLVNNYTAVHFKQEQQLFHSIKCSERALYSKGYLGNEIVNLVGNQTSLFPEIKFKRRRRRNLETEILHIDVNKIEYRLSQNGNVVLAEYNGFTYVFFDNETLPFETLKDLNAYLNPLQSKTQKLLEVSITGKCNWLELNDDTFEELCYDILYCHPLFDSSTIQKMGKSKSRDGGRDIVIKTKSKPGKEQEVYIFQCKFFSENNTLGASKLQNISDVVCQFGAKGYGVFTTTTIDSTLYDKLDGISQYLNIDTSMRWSKYELERYLNFHSITKCKYFKKS